MRRLAAIALVALAGLTAAGCGGITIGEEMRAAKESCAPSRPLYVRWNDDPHEVEVLVCADGRIPIR